MSPLTHKSGSVKQGKLLPLAENEYITNRALHALIVRGYGASVKRWEDAAQKCLTIDDLRVLMERRVHSMVGDYYHGGASDETTMRENIEAFQKERFLPHSGVSFPEVDMATEFLGHPLSMPVIAGPVGFLRTLWPRGEEAAAAASGKAGIPYTLSSFSLTRLEDVKAATSAPCIFQLYKPLGNAAAEQALERAQAAGYMAIELTIDTPVAGNRLRDKRNSSTELMNGTFLQRARHAPKMLPYLHWVAGFYADGGQKMVKFPNILTADGQPMPYADVAALLKSSAITWEDLEWIRKIWKGRILVKGVQSPWDAQRAIECGVDAMVVSNHGGRQLDRALPGLEVLKLLAPMVKGTRVDILMDGGIRSGADVVIALIYGATAVKVGRPQVYGVGAAGEVGVDRAYEILREEIEHTMRLLGCQSIKSLDSSYVRTQRI